jgi:uncharacterized membrane protein (UPF0127 family)
VTIGASVRRGVAAMILVGSGLLGACGSSGSSSSTAISVAPSASGAAGPDSSSDDLVAPSGFRAVIVTITRPDGSTEQHCMWIADDEASQQQGLMGVTDPELGGRAGMVFEFPDEMTTGFWMKDTPLPLSIAWFDESGSFISSAEMPPCPDGEQRCPTYRAAAPYQVAIEVPMGELPALGLVDRSQITLGESCS